MNPLTSPYSRPYIGIDKPFSPDDFKGNRDAVLVSNYKGRTYFNFIDKQQELVEMDYPHLQPAEALAIYQAYKTLLYYYRKEDPIHFEFKMPDECIAFAYLLASPFKTVSVSVTLNEIYLVHRLDDDTGAKEYKGITHESIKNWCENFQACRLEYRRISHLRKIKISPILEREKIKLDTDRWRTINARFFHVDCQPARCFEDSEFTFRYLHLVHERVVDVPLKKGSISSIIAQISTAVEEYTQQLVVHLRFDYGFQAADVYREQLIDKVFLKKQPHRFFVLAHHEGFKLHYLSRKKHKTISFEHNINALKQMLNFIVRKQTMKQQLKVLSKEGISIPFSIVKKKPVILPPRHIAIRKGSSYANFHVYWKDFETMEVKSKKIPNNFLRQGIKDIF